MKALVIAVLGVSSCIGMFTGGCVTSHTESDKPTLLGGRKHEETTTTRNPITGETKTTYSKEKVE